MGNLYLIFELSLYSVVTLSAGMLALGEEAFFPTALTLPIAWLAWYFTERRGTLRLSMLWSNGLGAIAVIAAVSEFLGKNLEGRLLAGAHFLVYLTWIVLFQEKRFRQYWWLMALGILQVAVGSILTSSGFYGLLLLIFLILSLWTLSVFTLYQGAMHFVVSSAGRLPEGTAIHDSEFREGSRSMVRGSVQHDAREGWINARFVMGIAGIVVFGLLTGLGVFLFAPRFWLGNIHRFNDSDDPLSLSFSGFSDEVRLGQMGQILESTERVLQVRLFDNDTNTLIDMETYLEKVGLAEPLFRGMVLDRYERGSWSAEPRDQRFPQLNRDDRDDPRGMIRQDISLEPQRTDVLFALPPVHGGGLQNTREKEGIKYDPATMVLLLKRSNRREPVHYTIKAQPRLIRGQRRERTAAIEPRGGFPFFGGQFVGQPGSGGRTFRSSSRYLEWPEESLQRVKQLAEELTQPERLLGSPEDPPTRRAAFTLESYLRNSGEYTYTLDMSIIDPNIDPVEDFLFNRKQGHCEYYASALALMLRTVGIPSRMITGFKGGDYHSVGGYYEVQQRHAHSWVEAFVDNSWQIFDATPAARDDTVDSLASGQSVWKTMSSLVSSWWRTYVVTLNFSRQREAFYNPLQDMLRSAGSGPSRFVRHSLFDLFQWMKALFSEPERWISWQGGVTAFVLMLFLCACFWGVRWGLSFARDMRHRLKHGDRTTRIQVEFYERFLKLLSRAGVTWQDNQTQREFACEARDRLANRLAPAGLTHLPLDLATLFYRVRFGGLAIEPAEQQSVARQLDALELCLSRVDDNAVSRDPSGSV